MSNRRKLPIALTIAGSDSGGGAGLQGDLKTFASLGVHGTTVITCLTVQNPRSVTGVQAVGDGMVRKQLEAVFAELRPQAAKTGMLYSKELIAEVAAFWRQGRRPPLVVDPVMVATSGAALLEPEAIKLMKEGLLPLADLITPNLDEAEVLTGLSIEEPEDLRRAARLLADCYRCAVLVKGGHLTGLAEAVDVFYDRRTRTELLLRAPYVRGVSTHGTGCAYSAAITAWLARGCALPEAVSRAKEYITHAIAQSCRIGRHHVLNNFWKR
ncbi:MAG: bifunctional hydroxymethylpyrimidine kinase/phosphomethylpyrimidine kinase [Verrucomicrobia bacterium]|nr:bifunctional hydroxymethylpyrimidine kinase/phosphomethylpyrimidine kinase [Verrucomicrobiota bacterium]